VAACGADPARVADLARAYAAYLAGGPAEPAAHALDALRGT
jgi:hypothetical protein